MSFKGFALMITFFLSGQITVAADQVERVPVTSLSIEYTRNLFSNLTIEPHAEQIKWAMKQVSAVGTNVYTSDLLIKDGELVGYRIWMEVPQKNLDDINLPNSTSCPYDIIKLKDGWKIQDPANADCHN